MGLLSCLQIVLLQNIDASGRQMLLVAADSPVPLKGRR